MEAVESSANEQQHYEAEHVESSLEANQAPAQSLEQDHLQPVEYKQAEEHPEWFMKDKYKSVDEQARAAYELQKKMGKYWGSPKDSYSVEGFEGVESNDPLVQSLAPALKDIGLSQEGFKHLFNAYQQANQAMVKNYEAELKKALTEDDAMTYRACDKWMNENLSEADKAQIQNSWLLTPQDFKLFNQIRGMAAPQSKVPSTMDNVQRFESSSEVQNDKVKYRQEVREGLRVKDKNYENELSQRFRQARSRELGGR